MQFQLPRVFLVGLTLAGCVLPPMLSAQATIGLIAGIVSAKVSASYPGSSVTVTEAARTGFAGGLTMSYRFAKAVAFAPEVLYVQKGYDQQVGKNGDIAPYEEIGTIAYVEFPLLFKALLGSGDTRFFLLGGPSVSFKVSCSIEDRSGSITDSYSCDSNGTSYTNSTDIGAMFGAGLSHRHLTISLRDDIGLSNILSTTAQAESPGVTLKNQVLSLMVGISFGR